MADLPEPAPEIIMAGNGVYWRPLGATVPTGRALLDVAPGTMPAPPCGDCHGSGKVESLSMVPVSDDNDPTLTPFTVYRPLAWEDHEGQRHLLPDVIERIAHVVEMAEAVPELARPRNFALGVLRAVLGHEAADA